MARLKYEASHTLNVIIECKVFIAVLGKQAEGIGIGKVLKLDKCSLSVPKTNITVSISYWNSMIEKRCSYPRKKPFSIGISHVQRINGSQAKVAQGRVNKATSLPYIILQLLSSSQHLY